ncbi:site-specific integrase, partial [bacterium]|nr:site-specific integrase [bacterium]
MGLNEEAKKNLEGFRAFIVVEKNFSSHTAKAYCSDILAFLLWLGDIDCQEVNFGKIREYLHFLQKFNYKKTTVARKI